MKYLLDTSTLSEPLRPNPAIGVMRKLREHDGEVAIPAPVWHELLFGCARLPPSQLQQAIKSYVEFVVLASFPVLEYDREAADWHAVERARLSAAAITPSFVDGQIAAIAHVNDLVLITFNADKFKDFHGLQVRSWA